ncbi:hypothetical protein FSC37_19855 [Piscinibacter aquaticus]|uniref:Anti-sigma factor n=1 Tax=Piscinibacter aquaticus TaxID=392597 RepID=A0A5C6U5T6_9BURK|nr:hypothetical protein FSC37_19855 [Piscinibacter aquaticus]
MNAPIDDTLFSAWLDGQLDATEAARVEAWLRDHPEDAARVRLWAADGEALRARLDAVLAEPVPQRLEQIVWRRGPARAASAFEGWQRWAAALAVFVLGGAVGAALVWRMERPAAALASSPRWRARRDQWPRLGAARRGGAQRLCAGSAPPGGSEGAGGTPRALAHTPAGDAGQALRPACPGLRAGRRPAAARCAGPERAADVPGHRRGAGRPDTAARDGLPAQAGRRHAGRLPLRAAGQDRPVLLGRGRKPRPPRLRLCDRRRAAEGAAAGAGAGDRRPVEGEPRPKPAS